MTRNSGGAGRVRLGAVAAALIATALLSIATGALASHPVKGATYSGAIKQKFQGQVVNTYPLSFQVSSNGKKATKFAVSGTPIYCQGGGFGTPHSTTAKISSSGTFKVKLPIIFAPTHQNQGNLVLTGKFKPHKVETGTATTKFKKVKSCDGTSKYKTKA